MARIVRRSKDRPGLERHLISPSSTTEDKTLANVYVRAIFVACSSPALDKKSLGRVAAVAHDIMVDDDAKKLLEFWTTGFGLIAEQSVEAAAALVD